jgi:hypothetical protein
VRWPQEWHVDTEPPGHVRNLFIVGADDDARQPGAGAGGVNRVRDQRPAGERREILSRNRLGPASRRNDTQNVQD